MNITSLEKSGQPEMMFQYNGKEKQEEFGLNWLDYRARNYDVQLGRFHTVDPVSDALPYMNPYRYGLNNPVRFLDPNGMLEVENDGQVVKSENEGEARLMFLGILQSLGGNEDDTESEDKDNQAPFGLHGGHSVVNNTDETIKLTGVTGGYKPYSDYHPIGLGPDASLMLFYTMLRDPRNNEKDIKKSHLLPPNSRFDPIIMANDEKERYDYIGRITNLETGEVTMVPFFDVDGIAIQDGQTFVDMGSDGSKRYRTNKNTSNGSGCSIDVCGHIRFTYRDALLLNAAVWKAGFRGTISVEYHEGISGKSFREMSLVRSGNNPPITKFGLWTGNKKKK